MPQKISDIMTPGPIALPLDATLAEAARVMRDQGIGDVLVTSEGHHLCGVVTDRDIVIRAVAESRDIRITPVGEVCTADVVTIGPDDDTATAEQIMRHSAIRRLPVVEGGRAVGIVSIGDLAMEHDQKSALSDISKAPPNT